MTRTGGGLVVEIGMDTRNRHENTLCHSLSVCVLFVMSLRALRQVMMCATYSLILWFTHDHSHLRTLNQTTYYSMIPAHTTIQGLTNMHLVASLLIYSPFLIISSLKSFTKSRPTSQAVHNSLKRKHMLSLTINISMMINPSVVSSISSPVTQTLFALFALFSSLLLSFSLKFVGTPSDPDRPRRLSTTSETQTQSYVLLDNQQQTQAVPQTEVVDTGIAYDYDGDEEINMEDVTNNAAADEPVLLEQQSKELERTIGLLSRAVK